MQSDAKYNSWAAKNLSALRTVLVLHASSVFAQAIFAGQFLPGIDSPVVFHAWTAWFIIGVSVVQILLAISFLRVGGPLALVISSVFVFIAEGLQTGTGYGRFLGVHVPLGVFVFGAVIWQMLWAFQKQISTRDLAV